ncbi:MAG: hypothetical protein ACTTJC_02950 [Campylobacter sp.]
MSYGVNVITLGGATSKWYAYKDLLRDKCVYIWFDYDEARY